MADHPDDTSALTMREAGRKLRLSERTIRNLVARGELRAVRFGRAVRIPVSEICRKLQEVVK